MAAKEKLELSDEFKHEFQNTIAKLMKFKGGWKFVMSVYNPAFHTDPERLYTILDQLKAKLKEFQNEN